jgi:hypothetical protein
MHVWTKKKGPYSQGSQDLNLEKIFSVVQSTNKYFVEFGLNEPSYTSGRSGANTRKLYENGWRGLFLDGDREHAQINLKKYFLFANNIAAIFGENKVPKDLDYLSCDMDSHDLRVFRARGKQLTSVRWRQTGVSGVKVESNGVTESRSHGIYCFSVKVISLGSLFSFS